MNRSASLKRLLPLAFLFCAACNQVPPTYVTPEYKHPVDASGPDAPIQTADMFSSLDRQFQQLHVQARAPLTDEAIDRLETQLPCKLPPLLREMYRWHDGSDHLFEQYSWLSLAEVAQEYRFIKGIDRQVGLPPELEWPSHLLPVFRFDGREHIAVDCRGGSGRLFRVLDNAWGPPHYRGLGHMLAVRLTAFEMGAIEYRGDYWDYHPSKQYAAQRRHALPSELQALEDNWRALETALRTWQGKPLEAALQTIERLPDPRVIPLLQQHLSSESPELLGKALFHLGQLRADSARNDIAALLTHPSVQVRASAANALGKLDIADSPPIIAQLLARLGDDEEMVRFSAIEALGNARAKQAVEPLVKLLASSRPGIQRAIADALAQIGDRSALPTLKSLQAKLATMDLSAPSRGGTRSADPPPAALKTAVDAAIQQLGG